MLRNTLLNIAFLLLSQSAFGQNSVLSTGNWYKVAVQRDGVYKLSHDQISKMGFSGKIDPSSIRIFGYLNRMLPQENSFPRPADLVELSIQVEGEQDGSFDRGDFVLFYAQGPNTSTFIPGKNVFFLQTNLYSDKNYYFITVGGGKGKRISTLPTGTGGTNVSTYHDFVFHETESINILRSGREWFGEEFELTPEREFRFTIQGIVANSPIKLVSRVMGQSLNPSSFDLQFNGTPIGSQPIPVMPDSPYASKGRMRVDTLTMEPSEVGAAQAEVQQVRYRFNKAATRKSAAFMDMIAIFFERSLRMHNDQIIFRHGSAVDGVYRYVIANAGAGTRIWNVSDLLSPVIQNHALASNEVFFSSTATEDVETFIAFNEKIPAPELIGTVANQNLRGQATPHLLIVSHPEFVAEAERLANHRRGINGIDVAVVTTDQVYNEFSSGRQDVTAIRDFARALYLKNPAKLKSLLLFGRSSYDYKQRLKSNTNFVPTYESRNSLSPLETFSSDDYFAFLEDAEGEWAESFLNSHTMDIGVGRLPVKSVEEARVVVDKLISYDSDEDRFGRWRKDLVFVADDGSLSDGFTSIHQSQANTMAEDIEQDNGIFNTRKIFLGSYAKKPSPNGETIPEANIDIKEEFEDALIVNYTGHGSETLWADERVLTPEDLEEVRNKTLPFLVTATCEFGRHDDPLEISSAEKSLLKEGGGSIGLVTTARPVNSSTNFELNQAFYEALFSREGGKWRTLGEVFRLTKNNSNSGVGNRNFSLLGDPSMTLALPGQPMAIDQIKTTSGSDTLKALSRVVLSGHILKMDGEPDAAFNGILEATLFDKRTEFRTIGKNDPAFTFSEWSNALFRGKATVKDGAFDLEFMLPKNIAYENDFGKLSLYAFDETRAVDAAGASSAFKVGGSETDPGSDTKSPALQVFMGDTTFVNGGRVSPNTTLVVRLHDESGINISDYGIGNTMMAVLDDDAAVFRINESFVADQDDFTRGWVTHPLYDLPAGKHTLTVKSWDSFNNPAEASVDFFVTKEGVLEIQEMGNYPNPFTSETTIFFTHNRPGDDLEAQLTIVNAAGSVVREIALAVPSSAFKVNLIRLEDNDVKKLSPGLYFARLKVRSVTDGAESEQASKLIRVN